MESTTISAWRIDDPPVEHGDDVVNRAFVPYITDPEAWAQYEDEFVYQFDRDLRAFMLEMRDDRRWSRNCVARKFNLSMIWHILYGRKWEPSDNKYARKAARIMAYYSTKIQKDTCVNNRRVKRCYTLRADVTKRPAYSIRLRIEEMVRDGITPTAWNMALPKDDLDKGHARNRRTERMMELRREEGRRRYREYVARRKG